MRRAEGRGRREGRESVDRPSMRHKRAGGSSEQQIGENRPPFVIWRPSFITTRKMKKRKGEKTKYAIRRKKQSGSGVGEEITGKRKESHQERSVFHRDSFGGPEGGGRPLKNKGIFR